MERQKFWQQRTSAQEQETSLESEGQALPPGWVETAFGKSLAVMAPVPRRLDAVRFWKAQETLGSAGKAAACQSNRISGRCDFPADPSPEQAAAFSTGTHHMAGSSLRGLSVVPSVSPGRDSDSEVGVLASTLQPASEASSAVASSSYSATLLDAAGGRAVWQAGSHRWCCRGPVAVSAACTTCGVWLMRCWLTGTVSALSKLLSPASAGDWLAVAAALHGDDGDPELPCALHASFFVCTGRSTLVAPSGWHMSSGSGWVSPRAGSSDWWSLSTCAHVLLRYTAPWWAHGA